MTFENDQLDRDALLMLYISDELSPLQRANFESRLASEPQLAADLASLRDSLDRTNAALKSLDAQQRLPSGEAVTQRRVTRAINQWLLTRNNRPAHADRRRWVIGWWVYPSAAAAILIVAFLVWSSRQEVGSMEPDQIVRSHQQMIEADAEALADRLETEFDVTDEVAMDSWMRRELPSDAEPFFLPPQEVSQ